MAPQTLYYHKPLYKVHYNYATYLKSNYIINKSRKANMFTYICSIHSGVLCVSMDGER